MSFETVIMEQKTTTDATPLVVPLLFVPASAAITIRYSAVAKTTAGVVKAWNGVRTLQRIGTASPVPVGTAIAPDIDPATGAPTWTISAGASGNDFALTFTGAAATTITWDVTIFATVNK
jgi:hypothetical protein